MKTPTINIPDKLYFSIGEVSSLTEMEAHTLRYWESEFNLLTPKKNKAGKRIYTKKDVENIIFIKNLLYQEKYTIEGAKKKLRSLNHEERKKSMADKITRIEDKGFLKDLKEDLVLLRNFIEYNCL